MNQSRYRVKIRVLALKKNTPSLTKNITYTAEPALTI